MAELNLDRLFYIAEITPILDRVEAELTEQGFQEDSSSLSKFQQDVGIQIHRKMHGFDENELAPGPISASLNKAYQDVTLERIQALLNKTYHKISDIDLKIEFQGIMSELKIDILTPQSIPKGLKKPNFK